MVFPLRLLIAYNADCQCSLGYPFFTPIQNLTPCTALVNIMIIKIIIFRRSNINLRRFAVHNNMPYSFPLRHNSPAFRHILLFTAINVFINIIVFFRLFPRLLRIPSLVAFRLRFCIFLPPAVIRHILTRFLKIHHPVIETGKSFVHHSGNLA